jgi:isopentenyldiphosphate isomerase
MSKLEIECETVTVKVPKQVMAFLHYKAAQEEKTVEQEIALDVIADVQSELESFEGEELIKALGLGPVFYTMLEDQSYKPTVEGSLHEEKNCT